MPNADREHLRRIAYGPDATARERAEAASALRQLDEQARVAREALRKESVAGVMEPVEAATVGDESSEHVNAGGGIDDNEEESFWQQRIRVGWLIPIAIGSLLLGVFGAVGASSQISRFDSLTSSSQDGGAHGDLKAADAWFKPSFALKDYYPGIMTLSAYGIDKDDVRFSGGDGVWVARTDTSLCLLAYTYDMRSGAGCVSRAEFARSGIALSVGSLTFSWLGGGVRVDGQRPAAENAIPVIPKPGPGNLDAANSVFDRPATENDAFPIGAALDGTNIDPSDVRFVGSDDRGHGLWVAKQRSGGFCVATYDIRKGEAVMECATLKEFASSGLTISTGGFAATWNGTEFLASGALWLAES